MRALRTGAVTLVRLSVLTIVLATAWTATVQPTYVAQINDGPVPVIDTFTTGLTKPSRTTSTSSTGSTGLTFTVIPVSLTIAKSHTGTFARGEDGVYTITVGNLTTASPTNGTTVTVHDILPAGLRADRITGTGWTCVLATLTCTRSDILPAGQSYPPVTLRVEVSCDAPAQVTNTATVTGGGDTTTHTATDNTTISRHGHDGDWHDGHDGHHGDGHHDHCDRHDH
ncbi:DUF11 domain-containing protein [Streptomyces sp. FH025]|uniref:DUF11 domain-containing protein n=1 Tax=Streptomyces sp. FH025 TaxID=2815937 RepID=UPI001A9D60AD|nr:DUF11 domain-containing protein [Streptomyces sp. FH025]MBO1413091.1 hypothetical protein [Streptomyces sp. FH025]